MRDTYHEQLDDILADLVQMSQAVSSAVRSSTTALLEADLHLAERVISDDELLDAKQADVEHRAFSLLARQSPVAGELRTLVAVMRMVAELERMGDVAEKMVVSAGQTLNDRNIQVAQELRDRDEEMDELRRTQFRVLLGDDWPYSVEAAVDVALLGRYYERIADHAASMARRVIYVVTGQFPESEDWPQP